MRLSLQLVFPTKSVIARDAWIESLLGQTKNITL
jgi:hypothetical protein